MKSTLIWLATLTAALVEVLVVIALASFFGAALGIFILYADAHGGLTP